MSTSLENALTSIGLLLLVGALLGVGVGPAGEAVEVGPGPSPPRGGAVSLRSQRANAIPVEVPHSQVRGEGELGGGEGQSKLEGGGRARDGGHSVAATREKVVRERERGKWINEGCGECNRIAFCVGRTS